MPETIGAIAYISKNLNVLKKNTIGGFILTCVGDERCFSYVPSRHGDTISDKIALKVFKKIKTKKKFIPGLIEVAMKDNFVLQA
jgi:aminopeptidase-like protein